MKNGGRRRPPIHSARRSRAPLPSFDLDCGDRRRRRDAISAEPPRNRGDANTVKTVYPLASFPTSFSHDPAQQPIISAAAARVRGANSATAWRGAMAP
jgi:hypothetical protein